MAKIPLHPVGRAIEDAVGVDAERNRAHMDALDKALADKVAVVHAGWGEEYVDRVHEKDKWTAWERIDALKAAIRLVIRDLLGRPDRAIHNLVGCTHYCEVVTWTSSLSRSSWGSCRGLPSSCRFPRPAT